MKRVVRWVTTAGICAALVFFVWWMAVSLDFITLTSKPFSNERGLYALGPILAGALLLVSLFVRLLTRDVRVPYTPEPETADAGREAVNADERKDPPSD